MIKYEISLSLARPCLAIKFTREGFSPCVDGMCTQEATKTKWPSLCGLFAVVQCGIQILLQISNLFLS
jgi:hypothetical protein